MTYVHARPLRADGLNEEQRAQLAELDQVATPKVSAHVRS